MTEEDHTPRAPAPRQGSAVQMGRPREGNHPEPWTQPNSLEPGSCCVTLNKFPNLSEPPCPQCQMKGWH